MVGQAEFKLSEVMGIKDNDLRVKIKDIKSDTPNQGKPKNEPDLGQLVARFDKNFENSEMMIQIRGHKMHKRRWFCRQNNNFLEIFKLKDTAFRIMSEGKTENIKASDFKTVDSDWIPVYRSEVINENKECKWIEIKGNKSKLASGSDHIPLKINVMDYMMNNGDHKLVGTTQKTLAELRVAYERTEHINITKTKKEKEEVRGSLTIEKFASSSLGC